MLTRANPVKEAEVINEENESLSTGIFAAIFVY